MPSDYQELKTAEAEKRPWTYEVAAEKARALAIKLGVTIYLVPAIGDFGRRAWDISRESREQREEYAAAREAELRKLHPERYPPTLTEAQRVAEEARDSQAAQDAEYRRLWEHDNPGLADLYYPRGYPTSFFADNE